MTFHSPEKSKKAFSLLHDMNEFACELIEMFLFPFLWTSLKEDKLLAWLCVVVAVVAAGLCQRMLLLMLSLRSELIRETSVFASFSNIFIKNKQQQELETFSLLTLY